MAAASVLALILAACGEGSSASGGKVEKVLIANVTDLSGAQQPLGVAESQGLALAVEEVNAAGGIKSLGGAKLEIKKYDLESNPNNAVPKANAALQDKASVVFGSQISDAVIAGTNVTHRAGVPWITSGGTAVQITSRGYNDVFQLVANSAQLAQGFYDVMTTVGEKLGLQKPMTMGLSYSDTTYGKNLHTAFAKSNEAGGFKVVSEASYPLSTSDLSSIAARMASQSPQVLFNEGYPTDGLNFARIFRDKFSTSAKVFASTATVEVVVKELGAKADGALLSSGPNLSFQGMPPQFATVDAAYKAKYNSPLSSAAVIGYQGGKFIAAALEKAGSADGKAVAKALHEVTLTHEMGNLNAQDTLKFTETGALEQAPQYFVQVQDGKAVGIYPDAIAAAAPRPFR
jgi:branched-chain amino acid transport system substrate-binding protein